MNRAILLTTVFAALTALNSSTAAAQERPASNGQISADLLAQFGLGGSDAVTDAEGLAIRGKGGRTSSVDHIVTIAPRGKKRGRRTIKRTTKRKRFVAKRLPSGRYTVKYRAVAKRGNKTVSKTGPSAPTRVSIPGRR